MRNSVFQSDGLRASELKLKLRHERASDAYNKPVGSGFVAKDMDCRAKLEQDMHVSSGLYAMSSILSNSNHTLTNFVGSQGELIQSVDKVAQLYPSTLLISF